MGATSSASARSGAVCRCSPGRHIPALLYRRTSITLYYTQDMNFGVLVSCFPIFFMFIRLVMIKFSALQTLNEVLILGFGFPEPTTLIQASLALRGAGGASQPHIYLLQLILKEKPFLCAPRVAFLLYLLEDLGRSYVYVLFGRRTAPGGVASDGPRCQIWPSF